MLFKAFSRVVVLISLCALFAAVASKPARLSRESLQSRIANRALSGTKTLKQYDARAPRTHERRQGPSVIAADRIIPTGDSNRDQNTPSPSPATDSNADRTTSAAPTPAPDRNSLINVDLTQSATGNVLSTSSFGDSIPPSAAGNLLPTDALSNDLFQLNSNVQSNNIVNLEGATKIEGVISQPEALLL